MIKSSRLILALALTGGLATAGFAQEMSSPDEAITANVKTALAQRPGLRADHVTVETRSGVVYLHGMVDTPVEKKDVETIAMQTTGVKKVVNDTTVSKGGS